MNSIFKVTTQQQKTTATAKMQRRIWQDPEWAAHIQIETLDRNA